MSTHTIRVSQRVFYDVEIEADDALTALRLAERAIFDPDPVTADLSDYPMTERDSGSFEIEAVQYDEKGQPIGDEAFLLELVRIIKD